MSCGIYKITNKIYSHCYIGLSKQIEVRWEQHKIRYLDKNNKEYDKTLYRAFRKYGLTNFTFEILELCQESQLNEREIYWISFYNSYDDGYNETPGGAIGNLCLGQNHPNHKLTEKDIIIIRTYYKNYARKKDIYSLYNKRIQPTGFHKIWTGVTWKHIMPEIYTTERINYHKHNTSNNGEINGRALSTESDIIAIRTRRKNGEKRLSVKKDYPQYSEGGFNDIWYGYSWKNITI